LPRPPDPGRSVGGRRSRRWTRATADQHHRWPHFPCRGLQRGNGRHRGRGPVYGRVRLLEAKGTGAVSRREPGLDGSHRGAYHPGSGCTKPQRADAGSRLRGPALPVCRALARHASAIGAAAVAERENCV